MLCFSPSERITASEALLHPYFSEYGYEPLSFSPSSSSSRSMRTDSSFNSSILSFSSHDDSGASLGDISGSSAGCSGSAPGPSTSTGQPWNYLVPYTIIPVYSKIKSLNWLCNLQLCLDNVWQVSGTSSLANSIIQEISSNISNMVLKIFQFFSDFDTFSNSNVLFQKIIIILSFVPNSHSDPKYGQKTLFWTSVKFRIAIVFTIFLLHLKSFFFDLLHTKLNRNPQNIISKVQYKIITWLFNNLDLDYSMQNNMSEKNKTTIQYNFLLSWTPPPLIQLSPQCNVSYYFCICSIIL